MHFWKPEKLPEGGDYCLWFTRGSSKMSHTLYFHTNVNSKFFEPFPYGIVPHVATKANSDFYWMGCLKSVWSSIIVCTQAHPQIQSLRVYRYVQGLKPHHPTMGKVLTLWRPKTITITLQNGCPFFQLFMDTKFYIKQK